VALTISVLGFSITFYLTFAYEVTINKKQESIPPMKYSL